MIPTYSVTLNSHGLITGFAATTSTTALNYIWLNGTWEVIPDYPPAEPDTATIARLLGEGGER